MSEASSNELSARQTGGAAYQRGDYEAMTLENRRESPNNNANRV